MKKYVYIILLVSLFLLTGCGGKIYSVEIQGLYTNDNKTVTYDINIDNKSIDLSEKEVVGYKLVKIIEIDNDGKEVKNGKEIHLDGTIDGEPSDFNGIKFKAIYEPVKVKIIYNLEGGNLRDDNISLEIVMDYGEKLPDALSEEVLVLPGYYFDGWYSKRNGLGIKYADEKNWKLEVTYLNNETFEGLLKEKANDGTYILNIYANWDK